MSRHTRAIRGAITVDRDDPGLIDAATRDLLAAIVAANRIDTADIISVIFTVTDDLRSVFPAASARAIGWTDIPLLCGREIPVPGSLPRCIRILLHLETSLTRSEIRHVYLRDARSLRPDLVTD